MHPPGIKARGQAWEFICAFGARAKAALVVPVVLGRRKIRSGGPLEF